MKIDLHQLANQAIRIGGPIVLAAIAHKLATVTPSTSAAPSTASDLKAAALEVAHQELASRVAGLEASLLAKAGQ